MKRLISCYASDFKHMSKEDFKQAIQASEGRVILAETVVTAAPLLEGVTNAEVMAAFGADLLVLNEFDVFTQAINGFPFDGNPIQIIKALTGRPVGINLEPVDLTSHVLDERVIISNGRIASQQTFEKAQELGVDFIMLTGNPSTGVSTQAIKLAIQLCTQHFNGLIFAGKMHGAGLSESLINPDLLDFIELGADGLLLPAIGTVPGIVEQDIIPLIRQVKQLGGLVMSTIGTSQESSDKETIHYFAMKNKQVGADIHHIGDGGYGRMPIPENITALSLAVRGRRHTYFRMAQSVIR